MASVARRTRSRAGGALPNCVAVRFNDVDLCLRIRDKRYLLFGHRMRSFTTWNRRRAVGTRTRGMLQYWPHAV